MKSIFLKTGFLSAAFFALLVINVSAQTPPPAKLLWAGSGDTPAAGTWQGPTPNTPHTGPDGPPSQWIDFEDEDPDLATVGSLMPYKMDVGELLGSGLANNLRYQYKWLFTPVAPLSTTPRPPLAMPTASPVTALPAALTAQEVAPNAYWYNEHKVAVEMPAETGAINLRTNVRFFFNNVLLCPPDEDESDKRQTITVVAKPKIEWKSGLTEEEKEYVFCLGEETDNTHYIIPDGYMVLSGGVNTDPYFEIKYTITFTPFENGDPADAFTRTEWVGINGFDMTFPGVTFKSPGVYKIDVQDITDRISRKSLMAIQGDVSAVTGSNAFNITILPKADDLIDMLPIQHVPNVYRNTP